MTFTRRGVRVGTAGLWVGAWVAWVLTGAALPVPPWKAEATLAAEEHVAVALAESPLRAPVWSIDVGEARQARALGDGWSVHEAFVAAGRRRSFVWIEGGSAEIRFCSPAWPKAYLSLGASPLQSLAPLPVGVALDGEERGEIAMPAGWTVSTLSLGPVDAGPHVLALSPRRQSAPPGEARSLSLAVDGVAIGTAPVADPARDRGVFAGWLRPALEDRPALFVSTDASASAIPPASARLELAADLTAWYGFGIGGPAGGATALIEAIHGMLTAVLVVLLPGLCWAAFLRASGPMRLAIALAVSSGILLVVFLSLRLAGVPPGPLPVAAGLALLGGAPLALPRGRGGLSLPWLVLAPAMAALAALTFFATRVVPPLEDQDMEVQATAHAIATRQVPLALTSRGTTYFFAHPPLLHLWEAGSFALSGRLPRVTEYEEAARRAQARPFVEPVEGAPLATRQHYAEWKTLLRRFLTEPHLWPTRQVNVLLAALAAGLLAELAASIALSTASGIALAFAFLTFPEFLVRGAYGGYFAASTLLTLLVLAGIGARAGAPSLLASSSLAFLSDQKGLLAPVSWALAAPAATGRRRFVPLAGALLGLAIYAAYGLGLDAPTFLYDFVKEHVVRRLAPSDVRFVADAARWYPSIPDLWREFAGRYGGLFTLWAVLAAALGLRSDRPITRAASASVLLGAIVFSLTDWRQTKHLSLLAAPALLAIAGAWPDFPRGRRIALGLVALVVARNLRTAWPLLTSFEALRPSTIW